MNDAILEMLAEAGMSDEAELSSTLFAMRSEATNVRPMPSAAVAALMPARRARSGLAGRRRIVTGLIVLGSLGIGAGAAAASPDIRSATQHFAQTVIGALGSDQAPSLPAPAGHRPSWVTHPSNSGAATHSRPTDNPGLGRGSAGSSHAPGVVEPSPSPGKGSPSPHPVPSPSDPGRSHRP